MPYRRPSDVPSPDILVPKFEAAIKSLVRRFRTHPYAFYTETDMHCYLYHRLYSGGLVNGLYRTFEKTSVKRYTILLHAEYPTAARYHRDGEGKLQEAADGRRRGAFDISVWDPRYIGERGHRKQKVLCAAELALNECGRGNLHTINDMIKLASPANVTYGYLLFFVRDDEGKYKANEKEILENLKRAAELVRVVFAMVKGADKPKPIYLGAWGAF